MTVKPRAYYNEFNAYAAQWLRNLIDAGLIAPGDVDERSIEDVTANDLRGYTQWHFFAGIGGWSRALRLASWPDSERVITASCPCQPFSAAGEGAGFADERHLWPACHWLITQLPAVPVFGEQVASRDANPWCDLVQADVEAVGHRFGAVPFPAASIGAAHIRERIYWVAHPSDHGRREAGRGEPAAWRDGAERDGAVGIVAHTDSGVGREGRADFRGWLDGSDAQPRTGLGGGGGVFGRLGHTDGLTTGRVGGPVRGACPAVNGGQHRPDDAGAPSGSCGLGDSSSSTGLPLCEQQTLEREGRREKGRAVEQPGGALCGVADAEQLGDSGQEPPPGDRQPQADRPADQHSGCGCASGVLEHHRRTGPLHGFWRDADWLFCRDGKWRPVEPGARPLVDGLPKWVGRSGPDWRTPSSAPTAEGKTWPGHRAERLKGYGNAIVPQQAALFIEQFIAIIGWNSIMARDHTARLIEDIVARAIRDDLCHWLHAFDLERSIKACAHVTDLGALRFVHIDKFAEDIKRLRMEMAPVHCLKEQVAEQPPAAATDPFAGPSPAPAVAPLGDFIL